MSNAFAILHVVLGLGLVVFVHELGHFIAARLCKVDVRVFSLGFGPPLFSFVRGGTRYQVALLPIGGFVAMSGEFQGDRKGGAQPGDVLSKSVGQRFFIYSAGVIMNLLLAVVLLPILFWVGVPFTRPMLGEPVPGGPAWRSGLVAGTEVLAVEGQRIFDFGQITSEIALAERGPVELLVRGPGDLPERTVEVDPIQGPDGFRVIEVDSAADPEQRVFVTPGGVAERAGMRDGLRLVGVVGQPEQLPIVRQLARALDDTSDLVVRVGDDAGGTRELRLELDWGPGPGAPRLGVAPCVDVVAAVRGGGPFAELVERCGPGVRLVLARGRPIGSNDDLLTAVLAGDPAERTELVLADGSRVDATSAFEAHVAARRDAVAAADDVALAMDRTSARVAPSRDSAARAAGIATGDRLTSVAGRDVADWDDVLSAVGSAVDGAKPLEVEYERATPDGPVAAVVSIVPRPTPFADIGFELDRARYVYRTTRPGEALSAGLASARKNFEDVWLALERIATAEISSKNIGGVISMSVISFHTAKEGTAKLLFFLCILSINLGVINLLPVPVLDGGHLVFLIVEKLKGGPVSERVLGYSQMVGFVMIVSLVVYVTWNDLQRWVLG